METKFQTSFIPKKALTPSSQTRTGGMSLFLLVSIILFLISLGIGAYVFLSKQVLIQNIANAKTDIEKNKTGLIADSLTIESLVNLDTRIKVSKDLLNKHIAISPIFDFLQKATLQSVRFKTFTFSSQGKDVTGGNKVSVQMQGVAKDWETVASQADEFGKIDYKKIVTEPKISNLSLNSDGSVSFLFSAYVYPDFLLYGNNTIN